MGLMLLEQGEGTHLREIRLLSGLRRLHRNEGGYFVDLLAREEMREAGAASSTATVAGRDGAGVPGEGCNIIEVFMPMKLNGVVKNYSFKFIAADVTSWASYPSLSELGGSMQRALNLRFQ
jgi:hypothetical protein